jgi:prephenate dehydratase
VNGGAVGGNASVQANGSSNRWQNKASIAVSMRNLPGAIFKMTSCFALRDIDILKMETRPATTAMCLPNMPAESRPFTHKHWNLIFYIDYTPSVHKEVNLALLRNLQEFCLFVRELGSYVAGLSDVVAHRPDWQQVKDVMSLTM